MRPAFAVQMIHEHVVKNLQFIWSFLTAGARPPHHPYTRIHRAVFIHSAEQQQHRRCHIPWNRSKRRLQRFGTVSTESHPSRYPGDAHHWNELLRNSVLLSVRAYDQNEIELRPTHHQHHRSVSGTSAESDKRHNKRNIHLKRHILIDLWRYYPFSHPILV